MPTYVLKINTLSAIEKIELPEDHDYKWYSKQIGCEWIEIVRPVGYNYVLIVDEEGRLKPNRINPIASMMYGTPKHGEPIVGTCLLMKEGIVDGEPDLVGLTEEEITTVMPVLEICRYTVRSFMRN